MSEFRDYRDLVKKLTARPAETKPYSNRDTTEMLLKIFAAAVAGGASITVIARLLAPFLQ